MKAIIVDLDGTLFDNSGRSHLIPTVNPNNYGAWEKFNKACLGDKPCEERINWVKSLVDICLGDCVLIFLTSRGEHASEETIIQLSNCFLGYRYKLSMRTQYEHMSSVDYKRIRLKDMLEGDVYSHTVIVDDNPDVCNMARVHFPHSKVIQVESMDCTI